jgi:hypothetical protein
MAAERRLHPRPALGLDPTGRFLQAPAQQRVEEFGTARARVRRHVLMLERVCGN